MVYPHEPPQRNSFKEGATLIPSLALTMHRSGNQVVPLRKGVTIATDAAVRQAAARFSVFLSNYNHGRFLARALDAILQQSVQPREICLIDDGSTDGSAAIIDNYASRHSHIRAVKHAQNRGVMVNLSEWLAANDDEFVYMAAADDVILPGLFEKSLAMLCQFPLAGVCTASSLLMSVEGENKGRIATHAPCDVPCYIPPEAAKRILMRHDGWFMGNTAVYRRSALRRAGEFDVKLGGFADGFACRVIAAMQGACYLPETLAYWRRSPDGMAGRMVSDPEVSRAVAERAAVLIRGRLREVFSRGYEERLRRRLLYQGALAAMAWNDRSRSHLEILLRPLSAVDRASIALTNRLPFGRRWFMTSYLALRLRPLDVLDRFGLALRGASPPGRRLT